MKKIIQFVLLFKMNQTSRAEKAKAIIIDMFASRGYTEITTETNRITALKDDGVSTIYAFHTIIEKLNNDEIHSYISLLQEEKVKHALLVYEGTPTPAVKAVIANLPELDITIELFHADDLQFDITKHELVPKHEKLSMQDSKEFKALYGTNIPTLLRTDAVVRFYDFHKGEIIKVTRKNGAISYRIVR